MSKDWLLGFATLSHEADPYSDIYGHRLGISDREIAEARARRNAMDAQHKACRAFETGDHTPFQLYLDDAIHQLGALIAQLADE